MLQIPQPLCQLVPSHEETCSLNHKAPGNEGVTRAALETHFLPGWSMDSVNS